MRSIRDVDRALRIAAVLVALAAAFFVWRAQWIDATHACSLAAEVLKPKVSLGR
jgi:hypothetical protein